MYPDPTIDRRTLHEGAEAAKALVKSMLFDTAQWERACTDGIHGADKMLENGNVA